MAQKLKFHIEAIDGNFERQYDTVEEFKQKSLGKYVGLSSSSMTSSDGICVYYPADDYTKNQIELYQAQQLAKEHLGVGEHNTQVAIGEGSGLGYGNLQLMKKHNKKHGNESSYYVETDAGRFFIETRDDQSFFSSMQQDGSRFNVNAATIDQMTEAFSKEKLGFGTMKKAGINCFILNTNTLLVQDKNKKYHSLDAIKAVKMSNEKGVLSTLRTVTYDGNEDTPGTTSMYHPAVLSVDSDTYYAIIDAQYPESAHNDPEGQYYYNEKCWLDNRTMGYRFDKTHPVYNSNVSGFQADILKDGEKSEGRVIHVDQEFLKQHNSVDEQGLTVEMHDDNTIYLELGKAYEITGGRHYNEDPIAFNEIEKENYKKIEPKENSLDFLF